MSGCRHEPQIGQGVLAAARLVVGVLRTHAGDQLGLFGNGHEVHQIDVVEPCDSHEGAATLLRVCDTRENAEEIVVGLGHHGCSSDLDLHNLHYF